MPQPVIIVLERGAAEYLRLVLQGMHNRQRALCETQHFNRRPMLKAEAQAKAYLLNYIYSTVDEATRAVAKIAGRP